jgi:hypothetical protein
MEIILAISIFSIVSAICLNIFVYSRTLSQKTADLNFAVSQVSGTAEILKAADSPEDAVSLLSETTVYYDSNYTVCEQEDAAYAISVTLQDTDEQSSISGLCSWLIQALLLDGDPPSVIYELATEVYYET